MTTTTEHHTAWLTTVASMLDEAFMDVAVIADELAGEDPDRWQSIGDPVWTAVTGVSAETGRVADAMAEAERLLSEAGWETEGAWEAVDSGYVVTVTRESAPATMTTTTVTIPTMDDLDAYVRWLAGRVAGLANRLARREGAVIGGMERDHLSSCVDEMRAALDSLKPSGSDSSVVEHHDTAPHPRGATMTTITITPVDTPTALYCRYPGNTHLQPVDVVLRVDTGELTADCNTTLAENPAGTQSDLDRAGIRRTWTIPTLTADAANTLLDLVAPLAQRVLDGATPGVRAADPVTLTADASRAESEIVDLIAGYIDHADTVEELDMTDLDDDDQEVTRELAVEMGLTADTTDADLAAMVDGFAARFANLCEGVRVPIHVARFLTAARDDMRAALEPASR